MFVLDVDRFLAIDISFRSCPSPSMPRSPLSKPTNSWVAEQQKEAPDALWASGARSYCEHAAGLATEFGDALSLSANGGAGEGGGDKQPSAKKAKPAAPAAAAAGVPAPSTSGGLFGGLGGGAAAGTSTFNFGSAAPAAALATSSLFGAPPAAGTSLFGAPPAPAGTNLFGAPPTGTFNFGGGAAAAAPPAAGGGGGFGFGGPGGAAAAADDDAEAEEEEETETVLDGGATILFKEKAKLHTQGPDKKWVDRGAGVLTVRAPSGGGEGGAAGASASSRRPYLVFTTDSGRVLLNAGCYRGLAAMKARKPHMVTASLATAAAGGGEGGGGAGGGGGAAAAPQISPTLFNLFAEGAADKFVAVLKEAASK